MQKEVQINQIKPHSTISFEQFEYRLPRWRALRHCDWSNECFVQRPSCSALLRK